MAKISVSLPDKDIEFLVDYERNHPSVSRSAAIQRALDLLREQELEQHYRESIAEWYGDPETARLWDSLSGDGLDDEEWPDAPR